MTMAEIRMGRASFLKIYTENDFEGAFGKVTTGLWQGKKCPGMDPGGGPRNGHHIRLD